MLEKIIQLSRCEIGTSPLLKKFCVADAFLYFIFGLSLITHLHYVLEGWNNTLLDLHEFRQTQTALTVFYMVKEGIRLDYITPVLGQPWSIPFEFPTYQVIVALIAKYMGTPVDQTGRAVNLAFFYATLVPVYALLGLFTKPVPYRLLILSMILVNPVYIFWSRTFMIESTALFFSWSGLYFFCKLQRSPRLTRHVLLTTTCCCMAGLTKITTFFGYIPFFLLLFMWTCCNPLSPSAKSPSRWLPTLLLHAAPVGMALLASSAWTLYADHLKAANPMAAHFITSKSLLQWNFGTLQQRMSAQVWLEHIFQHANLIYQPFGEYKNIPVIFYAAAVNILFNRNRRYEQIACLACYFFFPAVFTNLFYIHSYYAYENSILLSLFYGFFILSLIELPVKRLVPYVYIFLIPCTLFFLVSNYRAKYLPYQQWNQTINQQLLAAVEQRTTPSGVLLIYGYDWNPALTYYLGRKCLMDPWNQPLVADKISMALALIRQSGLTIDGVIFRAKTPQDFIRERIAHFDLDSNPAFQDDHLLFYSLRQTNSRH
jgi:hypothetical protein